MLDQTSPVGRDEAGHTLDVLRRIVTNHIEASDLAA